jgi:hypothetical protein
MASVLMRLGQDLAEQIRRREVSYVLKTVDHSPEGEEIMERVSYSLVSKSFSVRSPRSWGAPRSEPSKEGQPLIVGSRRVKVILRDNAQEVSK